MSVKFKKKKKKKKYPTCSKQQLSKSSPQGEAEVEYSTFCHQEAIHIKCVGIHHGQSPVTPQMILRWRFLTLLRRAAISQNDSRMPRGIGK